MTAPEKTENEKMDLTQSELAAEPKELPKKEDDAPATREELARVTRELRELSERVQRERLEQRAMAEIRAVRWFDPAEAARELLPKLRETDGALFVLEPQAAGGEPVPLAQAVADLAKRRPYWVKAELREGSGALGDSTGAARGIASEPECTYRDLLANPKRMAEWLRRDPREVARLRAAHGRSR